MAGKRNKVKYNLKNVHYAIAELDQMEEGLVMDMIIESGNDLCEGEYCQVADQHMYDIF